MASVGVDRVWIQDPYDWSECVVAGSNDRKETDAATDAEVRGYANDRRRLVSGPGTEHIIGVRVTYITQPEVEWLRAHKGRIVLYRDRKGTRVYGMYKSIDIRTYTDNVHYDVTLQLQSMTFNENVA